MRHSIVDVSVVDRQRQHESVIGQFAIGCATRVFAIDVGYGQLDWRLRQDERVVVLERENIRHLDSTKITAPADIAVIDVSFISLHKILDKVAAIMIHGWTPEHR